VSLSEDERRELERYRRSNRRSWAWETFETGFFRGFVLSFIISWLSPEHAPYFTTEFRIQLAGYIATLVVGILSVYYGPLKRKRLMLNER